MEGRGNMGYYRALEIIMRLLKPTTVVQTGLLYGLSDICIYNGLLAGEADFEFFSVDINLHPPQGKYLNKTILEDPRYHLVKGDGGSPETVKEAMDLAIIKSIDIFFHDSYHSEKHVAKELAVWGKYFHPGTLIIIDDIGLDGLDQSMPALWRSIKWPKVKTPISWHFSSVGLAIYPG